MKKIFILLFSLLLMASFPYYINAESKHKDVFKLQNIIGIEIIDDELFIVVLENYDNYITFTLGKCPNKTKTIYGKISKHDLVKYRDNLNTVNNVEAAIFGGLVGILSGGLGAIAGFAYGGMKNKFIKAIDDALINRNSPDKNTFNTKTKFECVETKQGSRGYVHRYKMSNYYVW